MTNLKSLKDLQENISTQLRIINDSHDNLVRTHNGEMIRGRKPGKKWTRKDYSRQSQNRPDFTNIKKAKQIIKTSQKKRNSIRRKLEDSQDSEYMEYINKNPSDLIDLMKNYDSELTKDKQVMNKNMDMTEISRRLLGLRTKKLETTQDINRDEFLAKNPSNLRVESDTLKEAKAVAKKVRMAGKVKIQDQTPIDASILNPAEDPTVDTNQGKVNVEINYQGKVTDVESPNEDQEVAATPQELRGSAPKANQSNIVNDGGARQDGGSENNNVSEKKGNSPLEAANETEPIDTFQDDIDAARGPNQASENTSEAQANTEDLLSDQIDDEVKKNQNNREFYGDDPTNNERNTPSDTQQSSEPIGEVPRKFNDSGERVSEPSGAGIFIDNPANDDIKLDENKKGPRLGIIIDAENFIKKYLSKMHSDAMGDNSSESCGCDDKGKPKNTAEHLAKSNCPILVKSGGLRHVRQQGTGQVIKGNSPTTGVGYIQDVKLRRDIRTGLSYTTNARVIHRYPTEFKIK
jgi:hypothetical protein